MVIFWLIVLALVVFLIVDFCVGLILENKYKGKVHYDTLEEAWNFISYLRRHSTISINKRKKCNLYLNGGALYEKTDTYYEINKAGITLWYGREELHFDLSKFEPLSLSGESGIYSEVCERRYNGDTFKDRYVFGIGSIENKMMAFKLTENSLSIHYDDSMIVILEYGDNLYSERESVARSCEDALKSEIKVCLLKNIAKKEIKS